MKKRLFSTITIILMIGLSIFMISCAKKNNNTKPVVNGLDLSSIPTSFEIGSTVTLPDLPVTDEKGNSLSVEKSVECNGSKVTLVNSKFDINTFNDYKVTYKAIQEAGNVEESITITVTDTTAPIIDTSNLSLWAKVGDVVDLTPQASDNSGLAPTVEISVTKGTDEVAVELDDNKLSVDALTYYTITYTATDSKGNDAEETVSLFTKTEGEIESFDFEGIITGHSNGKPMMFAQDGAELSFNTNSAYVMDGAGSLKFTVPEWYEDYRWPAMTLSDPAIKDISEYAGVSFWIYNANNHQTFITLNNNDNHKFDLLPHAWTEVVITAENYPLLEGGMNAHGAIDSSAENFNELFIVFFNTVDNGAVTFYVDNFRAFETLPEANIQEDNVVRCEVSDSYYIEDFSVTGLTGVVTKKTVVISTDGSTVTLGTVREVDFSATGSYHVIFTAINEKNEAVAKSITIEVFAAGSLPKHEMLISEHNVDTLAKFYIPWADDSTTESIDISSDVQHNGKNTLEYTIPGTTWVHLTLQLMHLGNYESYDYISFMVYNASNAKRPINVDGDVGYWISPNVWSEYRIPVSCVSSTNPAGITLHVSNDTNVHDDGLKIYFGEIKFGYDDITIDVGDTVDIVEDFGLGRNPSMVINSITVKNGTNTVSLIGDTNTFVANTAGEYIITVNVSNRGYTNSTFILRAVVIDSGADKVITNYDYYTNLKWFEYDAGEIAISTDILWDGKATLKYTINKEIYATLGMENALQHFENIGDYDYVSIMIYNDSDIDRKVFNSWSNETVLTAGEWIELKLPSSISKLELNIQNEGLTSGEAATRLPLDIYIGAITYGNNI